MENMRYKILSQATKTINTARQSQHAQQRELLEQLKQHNLEREKIDPACIYWSNELKKMTEEQHMYTKKIINDAVFLGLQGTLNGSSGIQVKPAVKVMRIQQQQLQQQQQQAAAATIAAAAAATTRSNIKAECRCK